MRHKVPSFKALGSYKIWDGKVTAYTVELDRDIKSRSDVGHLKDQSVLIDGQPYKCTRVVTYCKLGPLKKGDLIDLVVAPLDIALVDQ